MKILLFIFYFTATVYFSFAQNNSSSILDEIIIPIQPVKNFRMIATSKTISDSLLITHSGTATDFFKKFSFVHFRENGYGMVSSPSFRGTTAQHTAVLWNGIPINSNFLGQTDFNALSIKEYDEIEINSGGGSVALGSGAIGGAVLLNQKINFNKEDLHIISTGYSSMDSYHTLLKSKLSKNNVAYSFTIQYNNSKNNYQWEAINWKNINGAFENFSFSPTLSYKINARHTLSFFGNIYSDERHFSLTTPYQTPTKYKNFNIKNLLKWHFLSLGKKMEIDLAHWQESFLYYPNIKVEDYTNGNADTFYGKYFFEWNIFRFWNNSIQIEKKYSIGNSNQNLIKNAKQQMMGFAWYHSFTPHKNWKGELGLKKQWNKFFDNIFLYSTALEWRKKNWKIAYIHNKNHRIPTLNDLFWQPGGNENLKPEISFQNELKIAFENKNCHANINLYHNKIYDMIRWMPTTNGYWQAENTNKVKISGIETYWNYTKQYNNQKWEATLQYSYTKAINIDTNMQLMFVPKHKITTSYSFNYLLWHWGINAIFVGKSYTTSDQNEDFILKNFCTLDAQIGKFLDENKKCLVEIKINNLNNKLYYTTPARPMPNRNYFIQLTYKF